jgi:hypothetical protein
MSKYMVVVGATHEKVAEFEDRHEAENEIRWLEADDVVKGTYKDDRYEVVKVEM